MRLFSSVPKYYLVSWTAITLQSLAHTRGSLLTIEVDFVTVPKVRHKVNLGWAILLLKALKKSPVYASFLVFFLVEQGIKCLVASL